ncbi:MAG TPA: pirin family protein [Desulfotignum sp.]|nr:pirin family protein [Desulfotignum sp.]
MPEDRPVKLKLQRQPVTEGAGVRLNRIFGHAEAPALDPFLLLDDFRSDTPADYLKGFPWHPHRGIETITYVLKGDVEHGDTLGNQGTISSGDVQWMTAGSGIIHQEMPKGDENGFMHGFQLWANLPAARKMILPKYRDITGDQVPEVILPQQIRVRIIAGNIDGFSGPVDDIVIEPTFLDCDVPAGAVFSHEVDPAHTVFIYVIGGRGITGDTAVENGDLILFGKGTLVTVSASDAPVRFLLLSGRPLNEAVAWRGPIVMNTSEELETAFQEYRNGGFIKA